MQKHPLRDGGRMKPINGCRSYTARTMQVVVGHGRNMILPVLPGRRCSYTVDKIWLTRSYDNFIIFLVATLDFQKGSAHHGHHHIQNGARENQRRRPQPQEPTTSTTDRVEWRAPTTHRSSLLACFESSPKRAVRSSPYAILPRTPLQPPPPLSGVLAPALRRSCQTLLPASYSVTADERRGR